MKLEDLQPKAVVRGISPDGPVTVVSLQWHGSDALTLIYRGPSGKVAEEVLYRHDEPRLEVGEIGRPWSFDGDGALFRLVSEAHRIRLLRNRPAAETLLAEPGARYLPRRQMPGHQGEHVEEQLLHGVRSVDSAEGPRRT